ncbi:glutathione S-transferase [Aureobasidium pullulans]|uniref:Glutathione S-transferase n=1 Tax=Aureobasidium pullulans TaxID=5580 RepID=A0A4T0CFJ0_AURPU|nr:glutathione S-transferase [Aureobasidium pullulans]
MTKAVSRSKRVLVRIHINLEDRENEHEADSIFLAAILAYLARHYDTENRFSFKEDPQLSHQEQWIAWQHGGLGPMQGQANHFFRLAKERIPYPTQRYVGETERLMGILDNQLKDNSYLVGNKYSIADIANYSWVNLAYFSGVNLAQFPNLEKWWKSINGRPAVQKGQSIPGPSPYTNDNFQQKLKDDKEFADKNAELEKLRDEAKKQYDYKYSSP